MHKIALTRDVTVFAGGSQDSKGVATAFVCIRMESAGFSNHSDCTDHSLNAGDKFRLQFDTGITRHSESALQLDDDGLGALQNRSGAPYTSL